jgi:predicted branched-subunit amino acid permease
MNDERCRPASTRGAFGRGFVAMLPLWVGAIPVGVAFGVAAGQAGLSGGEGQAMSLLVFSAAAQVSAVALLDDGAPAVALVGAAVALNVQLLLLGLAVGRRLRPGWSRRLAAAFLLTDASYAVAAGGGRLSVPGLLGAGASMYLGWNLGTALGVAGGGVLPDPGRYGVELLVPLSFLAVLVPLLRTRAAVPTALAAGGTVLLLGRMAPGGVAMLGAGVAGSVVGAWWSRGSFASGQRSSAGLHPASVDEPGTSSSGAA